MNKLKAIITVDCSSFGKSTFTQRQSIDDRKQVIECC